jgi:ornithine decarboxylase
MMLANKAQWLTLPSDSASPTRVLVPPSNEFGIKNSSQLVHQAIRDHVNRSSIELNPYEGDETFVVGDLGAILRTHHRWQKNLPGINPFYGKYQPFRQDRTLLKLIRSVAVKCNSNPMLLRMMAALQMGFDCASLRELRTVLALGVDPSNIVFSHPCKPISSLRFARDGGVFKTVFDNLDELEKIKGTMPQAQLILRIYASDKTANSSFGDKFGAIQQTTASLLNHARQLDLNVIGVSFHVGK